MFDPAIISSLELPLPPEPPRIVEERTWLSTQGQAAERVATRMSNGYAASVDGWLKRLTALQAEISKAEFTEHDVDGLTEMITEAESFAERRATWRSRFAKRSKQTVKARFKEDPSLAAVERSFTTRLLATDDRVIEAALEYALFLRAVRSTVDPEAQGAPAFEDAGDLERYLRNSIAV